MKNTKNLVIVGCLLLITGILSSCSDGGSASGGSGITCNEIAGQYSGQFLSGDGQFKDVYIVIQNDCSFTAAGKEGRSDGVFTTKNNNVYYGTGTDVAACGGSYTITASFLENGRFVFSSKCN